MCKGLANLGQTGLNFSFLVASPTRPAVASKCRVSQASPKARDLNKNSKRICYSWQKKKKMQNANGLQFSQTSLQAIV